MVGKGSVGRRMAAVVGFLFIVFVLMLANRVWCSKVRWEPLSPRSAPLSLSSPPECWAPLPPADSLWSLPLSPVSLLLLTPPLHGPGQPCGCAPCSVQPRDTVEATCPSPTLTPLSLSLSYRAQDEEDTGFRMCSNPYQDVGVRYYCLCERAGVGSGVCVSPSGGWGGVSVHR